MLIFVLIGSFYNFGFCFQRLSEDYAWCCVTSVQYSELKTKTFYFKILGSTKDWLLSSGMFM